MSDAASMVAEWTCRKQLLAFYAAIDAARFADLPAFFTEDCAWTRSGAVARGRAGIAKIYEGRAAGTPARHIVTNLTASATAPDAVDFSLCITYYTASRGETVPTVSGPTMILSSFGQMALRDGRWLVREMETVREFMIGTPAGHS